MARKPSRPESEIQALADEWRSRRREGESVEAWMRRNVARLTRMVRDQGWRWDDVGRAMTLAGVTYSTGREWTPEVLRVRASEARAQLRLRKMRSSEAAATAPSPSSADQEPEHPTFAFPKPGERQDPSPQPAIPDTLDSEHERLRAKFGTGSTLRNSKSAPVPQPAPPPVAPPDPPQRSEQEVEEYLARVMGKPGTRKP